MFLEDKYIYPRKAYGSPVDNRRLAKWLIFDYPPIDLKSSNSQIYCFSIFSKKSKKYISMNIYSNSNESECAI